MAGLLSVPNLSVPATLPTLNPADLITTLTNAANELTLLAGNPELIPVAIPIIQGSISGALTSIPVIGTPLASAEGSALGVITQVIGPGETTLLTVLGSVTAVVGSIVEVIPVVGTLTDELSSLTGVAGSILTTPGTGIATGTGIGTGVPLPQQTPTRTSARGTGGLTTGATTRATSVNINSTPTTTHLPVFTNVAARGRKGSAGSAATVAVLGSMLAGLVFGGAAVVMM